MAKKKNDLTLEEKLKNALVSEEEQPYPIPDNWVWTRLYFVSTVITGKTPSKKNLEYYGTEIPFFKPGDLDVGRHVRVASEYLSKQGGALAKMIPAQSTAVCCIGTIGKSGFLEIPGATNQQINSAISFFNPLCQYYYMNTDFFVNQLKGKSSSTTIPIVNKSKMEACYYPLPPIHEQQRIVERIESLFSKLDEAKEKIQMSLDSFENRKSAILYKAFSGELTKKWREENGIKFKDWNKVELRERCHINPKKISTKELNDNMDITFIPMASVSDILGEVSEPLVKKLGKYKKGYTNFSEGDILFAKITPCMENGKIAVVKELENNIGFGSTEFHIVRCNNNTYNRFIYHLLRWKKFREEAKAVMSGAVGQQRVPKSFLEEYKISFPSLEEQKEIVHILDTIFDKEQDIQELIDLIENIDLMKKSILARAFRGELGTNIPKEESAIELLKSVLEV